jgi:3-hexulose-6-phosphate synthase / 6-phospho-3-hexuloisomerase
MDLIPVELLQRCQRVATSTWGDVLDGLGVPCVIDGLALHSGSGCVAGIALTVKESVGPLGSYPVSALDVGSFVDALAPGMMLMIEMGGVSVSTFGGLAAQAAVQRGAAGVVIDGGCRDIGEIRESGLWLTSRHVTALSGKRRVKVEAINVPVTLSGIDVHPGDCIIGDETGVICVKAALLPEALPLAEELTARDARFADALRDGGTFSATVARLRHM